MNILAQMTAINKRKLISRSILFFAYIILGIINKDLILKIAYFSLGPLKAVHLIWFILAVFFLYNLFFIPSQNIASGRQYLDYYKPDPDCRPEVLKKEISINNARAKKALFYILLINGVFIGAYFLFNLHVYWIYFLVLFYIFLDAAFIIIWCPFNNWIMKNKCCHTCRIHNWGFWMAAFPMLAVPSLGNYSIVFISVLILIKWEYNLYKYPERFYEVSNSNLACENCDFPGGFCREL